MEAIAISSVTPEQWSTFTSESRLRGPWSTQRRWADPGIVDILLDNRQFRWEWSGLRDTAFPSFWHPVTHIPFKFFLKKDHLISPMMNNASTSQHRKPYETSDDFFFFLSLRISREGNDVRFSGRVRDLAKSWWMINSSDFSGRERSWIHPKSHLSTWKVPQWETNPPIPRLSTPFSGEGCFFRLRGVTVPSSMCGKGKAAVPSHEQAWDRDAD